MQDSSSFTHARSASVKRLPIFDGPHGMSAPSMGLTPSRHLSWFRGYRFQVSGNTSGGGDYGSSVATLVQDLTVARAMPEQHRYLIALGHCAEAMVNAGMEGGMIHKHREEFGTFLAMTEQYEPIEVYELDEFHSVGYARCTKHMFKFAEDFRIELGDETLSFLLEENQVNMISSRLQRRDQIVFPAFEGGQYVNAEEYYTTLWTRAIWILLENHGAKYIQDATFYLIGPDGEVTTLGRGPYDLGSIMLKVFKDKSL